MERSPRMARRQVPVGHSAEGLRHKDTAGENILTPNPFSASLTISFETPASGPVVLQVFDLSGRLVGTLVAAYLKEGFHSIGLTSDGYNTGVYLIRLQFCDQIHPGRISYILPDNSLESVSFPSSPLSPI